MALGSSGPKKKARKYEKLAESDYIIPGYDAKGRSDLVQFRITPGYARMGSEILTQKKFPFQTAGDLYRWCLSWGLDHLVHVAPPPFNIMSYLTTAANQFRDQLYMREQATHVDTLDELVKFHIAQDTDMNKLYAKALVESAIEEARKIGDVVWRKNTLKKLRGRFKDVIGMKVEMPKFASHNPEDMEEDNESESGDESES
jgi:hypothetical protein